MEALSDTTRIKRLRVKGSAGARQSLLTQLACADWPSPPDHSWVLVRRVTVRGSARQLPVELVAAARKLARGDGDRDNVVRFASFTDLLAALTHDLTAGCAGERWYWRQWSHLFPLRRGEAVSRLMTEHYQYINGLCSRLAARGSLQLLWQALEPADARQVLQALAHNTGVGFTGLTGSLTERGGERGGERDDVRWHSGFLPAATIARWQPVLRTLKPDDPRFRLGLMLVALENHPVALRQAPAATLQQAQQQLGIGPQPVPAPGEARSQDGIEAEPSRTTPRQLAPDNSADAGARPRRSAPLKDSAENPAAPHGPWLGASTSPQTAEPRESADPRLAGTPARETFTAPPGQTRAHRLARVTPDPATPDKSAIPQTNPERFRTGMGGALYLLNVLNRPRIQRIMEAEWQALPSGWAWLWRLAETLGADPDDPLGDFLAEQLGLSSAAELSTLSSLPRADEILTLAWQWYGDEVWRPEMIRIPAQLTHTPSHVDLTISERYVRLELRLAGLDINPGWLPWLGRVVNFHFEHDPDPRGHPS